MNALVVQLARMPSGARFADIEWLVGEGWAVTLLATALGEGAVVPSAADVLEIGDAEVISTLWRVERFVVLGVPSLLTRVLVAVTFRAGGIRGIGRPARAFKPAALKIRAFQVKASRKLHNGWTSGPYRAIRSWMLWRQVKRAALPDLLAMKPDVVVCADRDSITTAWHLSRRLPGVPVTYGLNRITLAAQPTLTPAVSASSS